MRGRRPTRRDPDGEPVELLLPGGIANSGAVVRIGSTVRRPQRPTSTATHALLRHLAAVGFDGAPRFLGIDDRGREVLSYIPGTTVLAPYPEWALTDEALVSVAELLRAYHRAAASFDPTPFRWPSSPPAAYVGGLVSHNDPNLDNVVFRDGRAVALIDFDLASPGSRVWDVACAVRMWAPLRPDEYVRDARRGRALERLHLFLEAYGMEADERQDVVGAVRANQEWFCRLIEDAISSGHAGFLEYWESGAKDRAAASRRWLAEIEEEARAAVR
jgi:hypothetical protein